MNSTPEPLALNLTPLADAQGRIIAYLRLSLTDRCNFRCGYCSVSDYDDPAAVMTRAEIARLVGSESQVPLGAQLRAGATDEAIEVSIRQALARKAPRHHMEEARAGLVQLLPMMGIGG